MSRDTRTIFMQILVYVYATLAVVAIVAATVNRSNTTKTNDTKPPSTELLIEEDLRSLAALSSFSAQKRVTEIDTENDTVLRRREIQTSILGPIEPVNCGNFRSLCLFKENCNLFCKDAYIAEFDCNKGVCVERPLDLNKPGAADQSSNCNTKNGEYGLLIGYNDLGFAQWQCVQLYPNWQNREKYCEGGTINIDARVREPSYRDCLCPENTTRMVYKKSLLGQTVYGLPHCVSNKISKFYELSYAKM